MKVSPHTTQASEKASSGGAARRVQHACIRLCDTNMQQHPETGGRRTIACATPFAFLPKDGSPCVLTTGHPLDVCSLSGRAKFEPVSTPLQGSIRVLHHPIPASPSAHLTAAYLPLTGENRAYHVPQSVSGRVEAAFSPVVQQLCTVIGEHRILSTCPFGPSLSASFGLPSLTRFTSRSVPFSLLPLASPRPHDACSVGIPSRVFLIG
jgi:hypothetical protein